MAEEHTFVGEVHAKSKSWKLILLKEKGSTLDIYFSGKWKVNRHWGEVDYRGNPSYPAGPNYRGPGSPEGCLLVRLNGGNPTKIADMPLSFSEDVEGEIELACNDEPSGLRDNRGKIIYVIEYSNQSS